MCNIQALLMMAARFRENAHQTDLVEYQVLMLKAAQSLEAIVKEEEATEHTQAQAVPQLLRA